MTWSETSCEIEARDKQGRPSGRSRTCRVSKRLLKIVWSELHGIPWPGDMYACHHCDEPCCSNPHHIFPGTPGDNNRDAFQKRGAWGAIRRGEDHGPSKLTERQVVRIKAQLRTGRRQSVIAIEYGVDPSTISYIATGKRWGWLS